jgi:hypothetical protein
MQVQRLLSTQHRDELRRLLDLATGVPWAVDDDGANTQESTQPLNLSIIEIPDEDDATSVLAADARSGDPDPPESATPRSDAPDPMGAMSGALDPPESATPRSEAPDSHTDSLTVFDPFGDFGPSFDPAAFATEVSRPGAHKAACLQRGPAASSNGAGRTDKKRKQHVVTHKPTTQAAATQPIQPPRVDVDEVTDTTTSVAALPDTPKKPPRVDVESASKGRQPKMLAVGIGPLSLSISNTRSEICYTETDAISKLKTRKHLITIAASKHHGQIATELCRFAMNNDEIDVETFRFLAKEKLKEVRANHES